ncbi:hypothetical protein Tco_1479304, partial [Tanacetum coccineum]
MKRLLLILHNKMIYLKGKTWAVVKLPDPKLKTLGERGNECIFVGYANNFKSFKFYVIEPNEFVLINCRFSMKDMGEVDVILVSTPMDTSEKLRPNNGQAVSQLEYPSFLEGYTDANWISNTEDNSSTRGSVFFLGEGAISWAS